MGKGYMGSESKCPNTYRHIGIGNAIKYVPIIVLRCLLFCRCFIEWRRNSFGKGYICEHVAFNSAGIGSSPL